MCYQPDFSAHERAIRRALLDLYKAWTTCAREYIDAAGLDHDASVEEFYVDMLKQMQWLGKQERRHVRAQEARAVSAEQPHSEYRQISPARWTGDLDRVWPSLLA